MPHIDQANIACGFHAGDAIVMRRTLELARANNVSVGAHTSYPDLQGFGRRSMQCSHDEIVAIIQYQISALEGIAKILRMSVNYVKPHGAMYNDMMAKKDVRMAIMQAVSEHHSRPNLILKALPENKQHTQEAEQLGLSLYFEAFADRCYDDNGKFLSRSKSGAVHTHSKMMSQVQQLCESGTVTSIGGHTKKLNPDTICIHGDNETCVKPIADIKTLVNTITKA